MKTLFFAIAFMAVLGACKKSSSDDDKISALPGTWNATKRVELAYEGDKETSRESRDLSPGDLAMIFTRDSAFIKSDGVIDERYAYTLSSTEINLREGNGTQHMGFKLVDPTNFILSNTYTGQRPSGVIWKEVEEYYFKKE